MINNNNLSTNIKKQLTNDKLCAKIKVEIKGGVFMKGIKKAVIIISKIVEICHYVGAGFMAVAGVLSFVSPQNLKYVMDVKDLMANPEGSVYGFEAMLAGPTGQINYIAHGLYSLGGAAIMLFMALIFRNLGAVIERAEQKTPFCAENVKNLKEIGIYSIAIPLSGLAFSIILRIVLGHEFAEISLNQSGIMMGMVVFVLTSYFAHGVELEQDVDGLL